MPRIIAQVTFPDDGALPKDVTSNTWHFTCINYGDAAYLEVLQALTEFYTTTAGSGKVSDLMGSLISNTATVKQYKGTDPPKRVPVATSTFPITSAASSMPPEVAVCLSFRGALASGQASARRRGRVYLGPISPNFCDASGKLSATARGIIVAAASRLQIRGAVPIPSNTLQAGWAVYSKMNDSVVPVTYGWVDDAFDTQRRRGRAPLVRQTFGA